MNLTLMSDFCIISVTWKTGMSGKHDGDQVLAHAITVFTVKGSPSHLQLFWLRLM